MLDYRWIYLFSKETTEKLSTLRCAVTSLFCVQNHDHVCNENCLHCLHPNNMLLNRFLLFECDGLLLLFFAFFRKQRQSDSKPYVIEHCNVLRSHTAFVCFFGACLLFNVHKSSVTIQISMWASDLQRMFFLSNSKIITIITFCDSITFKGFHFQKI